MCSVARLVIRKRTTEDPIDGTKLQRSQVRQGDRVEEAAGRQVQLNPEISPVTVRLVVKFRDAHAVQDGPVYQRARRLFADEGDVVLPDLG